MTEDREPTETELFGIMHENDRQACRSAPAAVRDQIIEFYRKQWKAARLSQMGEAKNETNDSLKQHDTDVERRQKSELAGPTLNVFLCHSSDDKVVVRELHDRLATEGVRPWLDQNELLPGQDWNMEITKAVRKSHVVIVCLSSRSITKAGYVQKEIRQALDVADEQPEGTIFIIPVRLEECEVPERLRRWQWVDYFDSNGYERLVKALRMRASAIGIGLTGSSTEPPLDEPNVQPIAAQPPIVKEPPPQGAAKKQSKAIARAQQDRKAQKSQRKKADTGSQERHPFQLLLGWLADTLYFTFKLLANPIKNVLERLDDDDDSRRFREAFSFLVAMVAVYFVIEITLLYQSGIRLNLNVTLFFLFLIELVAYAFVLFAFAVILHGSLRMFRVPSDLLHRTLPCFFYYAAIVVPIYALLSYFPDLVEYKVVEKAGVRILLQPAELSRMTDELVNQGGKAYKVAYYVCGGLVTLWSFVGVFYLSKVLSKFYRIRFFRCLFATLLAYFINSGIETFAVKPVFATVQEAFIQASGSNDNRNAQIRTERP